jgi:hypothetical protein
MVGLASRTAVSRRLMSDVEKAHHNAPCRLTLQLLCPGNKQSGGKLISGKTKRCANRAAAALRLAANGLHRSQTALGAYLRRMKARLGAPKAITATAHKLARLVYSTLKHGWTYIDKGADWYEQQFRDLLLKSLQSRALQLGYILIPNNAKG